MTTEADPRKAQEPPVRRAKALKDDLIGRGFVLPREGDDVVAVRAAGWAQALRPADAQERWLVGQAAYESVRIDLCQKQERVECCRLALRAEVSWDDDRRLAAGKLATRLHARPELVSLELQRTSQGCGLMIARWEGLLALGKPWDEKHRVMALDLLGVFPALREAPSRIDPKPGEDATEVQQAVARGEIERLKGRREGWLDEHDEQDRVAAASGLGPPDRALDLVRRFESACRRRLDAALRHLDRSRRGDAPPAMTLPPSAVPPALASEPDNPFEEEDSVAMDRAVAGLRANMFALTKPVADQPKPVASVEPMPVSPPSRPRPQGDRRRRRAQELKSRKAEACAVGTA